MKKRILLSTDPNPSPNYVRAICSAGGEGCAMYCPPVDLCWDALVLCGGGDLDPALFHQEDQGSQPPDRNRDRAELALARAFLEAGKPVLGICRGEQVLNVALGGDLVQDLGPEGNLFHAHDGADKLHPVITAPGSLLHRLYGPLVMVNSAHHQAVGRLGQGLTATARSEGGVIEALELPGRPVLGVQFHPERMITPATGEGDPIFRWLLSQIKSNC